MSILDNIYLNRYLVVAIHVAQHAAGWCEGIHEIRTTAWKGGIMRGLRRAVVIAMAGAVLTLLGGDVAAVTCIPSGDQTSINNALTSVGSQAVLCQNSVFALTGSLVFTADDQEIYTEGFPTGSARAVLRVAGSDLATAVIGLDRSGVKLRNVVVDGNRPNLGYLPGEALIKMGGIASGQVVDHVKAYGPRSWSTIHIFEGVLNCTGAVITNNEIGPAGQPDGTWADGISLACRNSTVSSNVITDATDGAIVIFGAPGSLISANTIRAVSRTLLGGINMVDYNPFDGDYTGTQVTGNTIDAAGAQIQVAIAMGPLGWNCPGPQWPAGPNMNGSVTNNTLTGAFMGYGLVADGVANWTVSGNVANAIHSGVPSGGCGQTPAAPKFPVFLPAPLFPFCTPHSPDCESLHRSIHLHSITCMR